MKIKRPLKVIWILLTTCLVLLGFSIIRTLLDLCTPQPWSLRIFASPEFVQRRTLSESGTARQPETTRCQPKENVVFIKTHKCASTTIQNILMRFGDYHNLTFALPPKGGYIGDLITKFPIKFQLNETLPLPSTHGKQLNILTHHTRFHRENMKAAMPADTVYISIIREPAAMFEAMYDSLLLHDRYDVNLTKFLESPAEYFAKADRKYFGRNPMMSDFGLAVEDYDNNEKIEEKLVEIRQSVSLIMIQEFMDESLVLLRHVMCWDWDDVVVFRLNARHSTYKQELPDQQKEAIRRWNSADQRLYALFREVFLNQTRQYGLDRMRRDVRKLRDLTQEWYDFCVKKEATPSEIEDVRFKVYHHTTSAFLPTEAGLKSPTCLRLATADTHYTNLLRAKLWPGSEKT